VNIATLTLTVTAAATLAANRFVTAGGAVPAAGANCIGVTRTGGATGDLVPTDVMGTTLVEAGGSIAAGAAVECDNTGKAITKNTGATLGRLVPGQAAVTSGQLVEVLLIPN
jgi:hypothetical protein